MKNAVVSFAHDINVSLILSLIIDAPKGAEG
jgi:hypothetical protein